MIRMELCKVYFFFWRFCYIMYIDFLDPNNIIGIRKILIISLKDKSIFQNVVRGIQMHPPINIILKFSLSANFVYIYT